MTRTTTQTTKTKPAARAAGEALRLDNQLCFALYAASGLVTRAYRPLLEPLGLTYPQYLVMMALWERAPRAVKEIGQALDLDSGTLTPLLKRLETAGFVTRRRDSEDERRVQVELTGAGLALRERAAEVPAALACQLHLPLDEIVGLRATLQDLARKMR
ncbi:MarR family winged helix-turn-helix transcriptional regulator [Phenylobacterium sp.]|uniref:MarR family winged helix-turn-helix transcriptional regulator n=1 Tax=Phenylobacterium sp. TaxID=1871053 RepID=UPI002734189F|nr:MarR family transcriptional regulator [Phenylobacterium sp.]MDP3855860.1 MarR family transcriptional regulator [Phenylobacterium sp.]